MKPIIIGYDGSPGARGAIEYAGDYFAGREAVVVTAVDGRAGSDGDEAKLALAEATAEEGAALARDVGIVAEARATDAADKPWQAIIELADELDAGLILVGSHGFDGSRPLVLGSVSHQLGHLAHQPVLAVPTTAAVAARRAQKSEKREAAHSH